MARALWKGHISFGLVNVPVVLYTAERKTDLSFVLVDTRNNARIRYNRVNEATGEEVPWDNIVKGFEYDDGSYVLLGDEDFEKVDVEATQTIEIENFVERGDIDIRYYDKPYYLEPGKKGEKPYVLLREALKSTDKVGIGKVVIRSRQHLAALVPYGDAIVLNLLRFDQELRPLSEFNFPSESLQDLGLSKKETDLAEKLIDSLTVDWAPETYHDEYRDALMKWIEEKIEKGKTDEVLEKHEEKRAEKGGKVIDLMGLLKESVEKESKSGKRKSTAATAKKKSPPAKKRKTS
jgi:DNA end-binding protein Ku